MNQQLYTATIKNKNKDGFIRFTLSKDCFHQAEDLSYLYVLIKGIKFNGTGYSDTCTTIKISGENYPLLGEEGSLLEDSLSLAPQNAVREVALLDSQKQPFMHAIQEHNMQYEGWDKDVLKLIENDLPSSAKISEGEPRFPFQYAPCYKETVGACINDLPMQESKAVH